MSKFEGLLKAVNRDSTPGRSAQLEAPPAPKRRGRPAGKRSDPDFEQITAYIRKQTHHAVKLELLKEGQGTEFSELLEELLAKWLAKKL